MQHMNVEQLSVSLLMSSLHFVAEHYCYPDFQRLALYDAIPLVSSQL